MISHRLNTPLRRCYDFTVALSDPRALLFTRHIRELSAAVRTVQHRRRFHIHAFVVLPRRVHCIWTLSPHNDMAMCWAQIVEVFAARIAAGERSPDFDSLLLQRAAWSSLRDAHAIRDAGELCGRIARLHRDPVEQGLVTRPALWPWSSYRREARTFRYANAECDGSAGRFGGVRDAAFAAVRYGVAAARSNVV